MSFRVDSEHRLLSTSGQSTIDYLTVPDTDLLPIPPQSPGSLSVPGSLTRNIAEEQWRRASSTASSIFDLSNEAEQLERALQENDVLSLSKIIKLHHAKFPVRTQCSSIMEKGSFDSRSQRFSHGSQTHMERFDRRESVATDASDVPLIFRTSLHVAIQNGSMDVLRILLKYGIDPNIPNYSWCTMSRRNSVQQDNSFPISERRPSTEAPSHFPSSNLDTGSPLPLSASTATTRTTTSIQQSRFFQRESLMPRSNRPETSFRKEKDVIPKPKAEVIFDFSFNYSQEELMNLPALYIAIVNGNKQAVQLLLEHGANANVQDRYGVTPLHLAVCADFYNAESVQNLLRNGAKITMQSFFGMSPCHLRPHLEKEQQEMIQTMLASGPLAKSTLDTFNMGTSQDSGASSSNSVTRFFKRLNSENRSSKLKDKRVTLVESAIESDLAERASSSSSYRSARSRLQSTRFSITEDTETDISMVSDRINYFLINKNRIINARF